MKEEVLSDIVFHWENRKGFYERIVIKGICQKGKKLWNQSEMRTIRFSGRQPNKQTLTLLQDKGPASSDLVLR